MTEQIYLKHSYHKVLQLNITDKNSVLCFFWGTIKHI